MAKNGYVRSRCGWFSDRSVMYLALGRPVILQETGWSEFYPHGEGLLPFHDEAGAAAALGGSGKSASGAARECGARFGGEILRVGPVVVARFLERRRGWGELTF